MSKSIIIIEFNKFTNTDKTDLKPEDNQQTYKSGYWNVKKYSHKLADFLQANNIAHRTHHPKPFFDIK